MVIKNSKFNPNHKKKSFKFNKDLFFFISSLTKVTKPDLKIKDLNFYLRNNPEIFKHKCPIEKTKGWLPTTRVEGTSSYQIVWLRFKSRRDRKEGKRGE